MDQETKSDQELPGFAGTPNLNRFPLYVGWREGKGFRLGVQVRGRAVTPAPPAPLESFPTLKAGEKLIGDLNERVARILGLC